MTPLPRAFSARDTVLVARALLGQLLVHEVDGARRVGRIVETEAYLGPHDLACHSSKGRTARTEVMFGPPGHAYVFLVYGMHHCVNVVTGNGAAVLLRALEPLEGLTGHRTDGPGRLTRALGLTRAHDGLPLDERPLYLARGVPVRRIGTSARIGVEYAGVWARRKLRFFEVGQPFVSGYR
ncbi:MAG: DNA-3-methyladenine glycosylase [Myxococcaceae bacterium]|nr:DNA-3-methyladenine glycosylase [Myxococcaceae bacterium]